MLEKLTEMVHSTLLRPKATSVVGIDLGNSSIKVVQLRKERGTAVLETYGELALGPYAQLEVGRATNLSQDKIAEALKDVIKESNVTSTSCGAAIPFSSSLVTLLEMPALGAQQLASMIPIEARKYIPVPISEVQLDWFVVPEGEAKYFYGGGRSEASEDPKKAKTTLVLLVAIHSDTLAKYTDALKLAGLSPSFYEIETFSAIRSIAERGMTPVAVVDIGAATTKVYVVQLGIILSSHVISKGSQDITLALANTGHTSIAKAEEMKRDTGLLTSGNPTSESSTPISHIATLTMEYIFIEVQRALLSFEKKYNQAIGKVVLTGGGATMKGLDEFARKKLEIQIERADPFAHVQAPAFLEEVLKEAGPEFSVAVGVALRKLQEIG